MIDSPTYKDELKNELSLNDCIKIIDDFAKTMDAWEIRGRINFTGGNPLLNKNIFKLIDYANKKGIFVGLMGNPYYLSLKIAKKLKQLGVQRYQLSLDGLEKTHDMLRKKGSFKATVHALKILKKAKIPSVVMFTLSKLNKNELIPLIRFLNNKVDIFDFARLVPEGKGKQLKKEILSPQEHKELLFKILEEYRLLNNKNSKTHFGRKDHLWKLLYKEIGILRPTNDKRILDGCSIGARLLVILTDGKVMACRRLPI
ncbi:MAG: radical SAM protein, partial [Candidatus Pacearchaeota archaeon]|nr:radical SAM protein [Candidatus Pacearchaeota archaeon]